MKKISSILLLSVVFLLAFCKSTKETTTKPAEAFVPSDKQMEMANKRWVNTNAEEVKSGQMIFTTKCTKCHANQVIPSLTEAKWMKMIDKMSPKANLTPEEKTQLTKYILSYRDANTTTN